MSDSESDDLTNPMSSVRSLVEKLTHESKKIYANALKISSIVEHPDLDLWTEEFSLNERAYKWAKKHMVSRKCSLWQVHRTLLESAKKDKRLARGQMVKLTQEEADILDLTAAEPVSVWQVLGRLPRFFA
jgi:poly(3-hydroxyalkanoate) synthetase